jgi:hypothetical protein
LADHTRHGTDVRQVIIIGRSGFEIAKRFLLRRAMGQFG